MKMLNDYYCQECDFTFEEFGENTCSCPKCSSSVKKIISPIRFKLEGVSGDFPTAYDKWTKDHERSAKHRQGRDDWGDPIN